MLRIKNKLDCFFCNLLAISLLFIVAGCSDSVSDKDSGSLDFSYETIITDAAEDIEADSVIGGDSNQDIILPEDVTVVDTAPISCDGGLVNCNGLCVDILTNDNHCGQCNNVCQTAFNEHCSAGTCVCGTCPAGNVTCAGSTPCVCIDLNSDDKNCGTCGNACAVTEKCWGRLCLDPNPQTMEVDCGTTTVTPGQKIQCRASATWTNGTVVDVTDHANTTWSIASASSVCDAKPGIVSNTSPTKGEVTVNTGATIGCAFTVEAILTGISLSFKDDVELTIQ